jgi:hypothetical protein
MRCRSRKASLQRRQPRGSRRSHLSPLSMYITTRRVQT